MKRYTLNKAKFKNFIGMTFAWVLANAFIVAVCIEVMKAWMKL